MRAAARGICPGNHDPEARMLAIARTTNRIPMTPIETTDEELVARYARGETAALEVLVARHFEPTFRLAIKLLRDREAAEDAAAEAFGSLIRSARTFDAARTFRPWWGSVVLNAIRKEARGGAARHRRER